MGWTAYGRLQPTDIGRCLATCHRCLDVCPFQNHTENEDTLAAARFAQVPGILHTMETGYYLSSYAGFAHERYRDRGASGGIASWVLVQLLERGMVDRVVCVRPTSDPNRLFQSSICATGDEVRSGAKSAYYPVEFSDIIRTIHREPARYAVVGLPCVLKALQLALLTDARLRKCITVMVGLVCGQLKSRGFTEYLLRTLDLDSTCVQQVRFREKDVQKSASELIFTATDQYQTRSLPWSDRYGVAWHSGEFSLRACDFCDDIFAEVADIACMDAWLPAYTSDGRGTSIALLRSEQLANLLQHGRHDGSLSLHPIPIDQVIASQMGVIRKKRMMLAYRLAQTESGVSPQKRVQPIVPPPNIARQLVARAQVRDASYVALHLQQETGEPGLTRYREMMAPVLAHYAQAQRIPVWRRLMEAMRRRMTVVIHLIRGKKS